MRLFEYRYDLRSAFDDLLTMSLCAFSQNPGTGKSYDEDLYMQTIARYKDDKIVTEFPRLMAQLVVEMEERLGSGEGHDVLGEFYEYNLCKKGSGQFFTPWPICRLMAESIVGEAREMAKGLDRPVRVLDPSCGSGRMLLAYQKAYRNQQHDSYGIDIDHTCVKMTAINLFLSGMFHSEAMCADALVPGDFRVSYRTSFLPFGVFRIQDKEQSYMWRMLRESWNGQKDRHARKEYDGTTTRAPDGSQLHLF